MTTYAASDYAKYCSPSRDALRSKGKKVKRNDDTELADFKSEPPKNAAEKREWDRLSTRMNMFHEYFRQSFRQLWDLADSFERMGLSLPAFMAMADDFRERASFRSVT